MRVIDMAELVADRCEAILGFRPEVIRPQPAAGETAIDLEYCIAKLKATGFQLRGEMKAEIDATLRVCRS